MMLFPHLVRSCLIVLLLFFSLAAGALITVPELSNPITDLTGTLNTGLVTTLNNKLTVFETEKGSQIAVLIVPTTKPKQIVDFGIEVADLWQANRKGSDNSVILIIAKDDNEIHLEVGYDLQNIITDKQAQQIVNDTISPFIKMGDLAGGISAGVERIIRAITEEPTTSPSKISEITKDERTFIVMLFGSLFIGFALFILIVV